MITELTTTSEFLNRMRQALPLLLPKSKNKGEVEKHVQGIIEIALCCEHRLKIDVGIGILSIEAFHEDMMLYQLIELDDMNDLSGGEYGER